MIRDWLKLNSAWQPFTFGGVAAFARTSLTRLLLFQLVFALTTAGTVVWFLNRAWRPAVERAIDQLPDSGEIRGGQLTWTDASPKLLSENSFLAFNVDLNHGGTIRVPAHIQVEFGARDVRIFSLFGFWQRDYATDGWIVDFNKPRLEPWWGAWRVPMLWIVFGATSIGLLIAWWVLATLYFFPTWLIAFFSKRQLSVGGSWKIAGAALLPAGLLMTAGIFFYGVGAIGLIELLGIHGVHWLMGITFWIGATQKLPRTECGEPGTNPFDPKPSGEVSAKPSKPKNPFQKPS